MAAGDVSKTMMAVVAGRLGDPAYETYTEAEVLAYLNAGFREVADFCVDRALWALTDVEATALLAGTKVYDLPSDILRPTLLLYKTIPAKLWPHSQLRAQKLPNAEIGASETKPYWMIWNDDIEVFVGAAGPTQANGDTIELWYLHVPVEISLTVDPELPEHFYNAVETYAVSVALAQGDGAFDQSAVELVHFYAELQRINAHYTGEVASTLGLPGDANLGYLFPGEG